MPPAKQPELFWRHRAAYGDALIERLAGDLTKQFGRGFSRQNLQQIWIVAPLKRNFKIVGGSTPKSEQEAYWDGEIVWVTPSDLSKLSSIGISNSQRKIMTEGLVSCGTTLVPSGSIVLSARAPIGSLAIAETELCTNQGCKSLVPFADTQSHFIIWAFAFNWRCPHIPIGHQFDFHWRNRTRAPQRRSYQTPRPLPC